MEREKSMDKKGLVLEGGGMRGVFTAGVLDCFLDEEISFNDCFAVSAGACHACSYLSKQRGRALSTAIDYLDDKRYCSFYSLVTTGDLFGKDFVYYKIPNELYPIDNEAFLKCDTKFYAVITNCITGKAEYKLITDLKKDIEIVRASSSLPMVSKMVEIDSNPYLDGGISDSIPIKAAQRQKNDKIVVVLTRHEGYRKSENKLMPFIKLKYRKYPDLAEQIALRYKNYNDTIDYITEEERKGNIFVIRPPYDSGIERVEKNREKLKALYQLGYDTAKTQAAKLKEYLK